MTARQGCLARANRVRLVGAGIAALAIAVCAPAAARADGGGATVRALPESSSVEVSARVEHSCASETPCAWFAAAAVYSSSSGCPYSFDATHGVWQSGLEEVGVPTDGHFTIHRVHPGQNGSHHRRLPLRLLGRQHHARWPVPSVRPSHRARSSTAASGSAGAGTPPSPCAVRQRTLQARQRAGRQRPLRVDHARSWRALRDRASCSAKAVTPSVAERPPLCGGCGPPSLDMYRRRSAGTRGPVRRSDMPSRRGRGRSGARRLIQAPRRLSPPVPAAERQAGVVRSPEPIPCAWNPTLCAGHVFLWCDALQRVS